MRVQTTYCMNDIKLTFSWGYLAILLNNNNTYFFFIYTSYFSSHDIISRFRDYLLDISHVWKKYFERCEDCATPQKSTMELLWLYSIHTNIRCSQQLQLWFHSLLKKVFCILRRVFYWYFSKNEWKEIENKIAISPHEILHVGE